MLKSYIDSRQMAKERYEINTIESMLDQIVDGEYGVVSEALLQMVEAKSRRKDISPVTRTQANTQ